MVNLNHLNRKVDPSRRRRRRTPECPVERIDTTEREQNVRVGKSRNTLGNSQSHLYQTMEINMILIFKLFQYTDSVLNLQSTSTSFR